ncbi:uncharacterized protein LOC126890308 [Diabrotica virgifera virgifera]|uniref:Tc1-like transposase DDE domain-containing protein n=2 Tax=Diabrotica virgifera virgifera TaxID=50390 RepID=A0ABM5KY57_DIAVI|nr:uncharacterized protein LOC126890308 [Diabrotica virgifera virgifera]
MPRRVLDVDNFIFNVHAYFTAEKINGGPLRPVQSVHKRVCDALCISEKKLQSVLQKEKRGQSEQNAAQCKSRRHLKTVDLPEGCKFEIRETIYKMRERKEHVSLDSVLEKLKERKTFEISRTSLWRVLRQISFKFKKEDNRKALCERASVVHKRIEFFRNYKKFKKEFSSFVYLDETWIFSKGGIKRIWQDESTKSIKHTDTEGKRYIIVHAGGKHGFIEGADLVFSSKSKSADYHDNMNTEIFLKWLKEKLLPSLHEPSVIVLDNASYHSEILNKQPTNSWTVDKIKEWLTNKNITFPQYCFKPQLLTLAKSHAQPNIYMVDEIIHSFGHRVLRLPPYHCQFNPIEYIWGICKTYFDNHIGYKGYSEEAVLETWQEALDTATPEIWEKKCKKM